MVRRGTLVGWIALLIGAGCSDSHSRATPADPASPPERGSCVTHWTMNTTGQAVSLYENGGRGPVSPIELLRIGGGDRGWVVHTRTDATGDGVRDLVVRGWYPGSAAVCESISLNVFEVRAMPASDWSRESVSSADCAGPYASLNGMGDWNADGIDDLVAQGLVFVRGATGELEEDLERCTRGGLLGDVDADGWSDSGCDASTRGGGLWIVWGGAERAHTMLPIAGIGGFVAAGDVNGDGFDDFVAYDYSTVHSLVLGGSDREGLYANVTFPRSGTTVFVLAPGDVNGDGFDDLVVTEGGDSWLHRGASDFRTDNGVSLAPVASGDDRVAAAGDANCDGFADLLVRRPGMTTLYLGSSDGVRTEPAWSAEFADLVPVFAAP